jgi:hypothetical protein
LDGVSTLVTYLQDGRSVQQTADGGLFLFTLACAADVGRQSHHLAAGCSSMKIAAAWGWRMNDATDDLHSNVVNREY